MVCSAVISPARGEDEKVFGLPKSEILYTNPEEALKNGKPVRIERATRYIKQWGVWLLTEDHLYYEGGDIMVSLRAKDGKVLVTYPPMAGPLIISEIERRILDCGISAHYQVEGAVLFDIAGKEVRKIPKVTYTRDCGKTHDSRLFWLNYNAIEKGAPISVVRFIDRDGKTVYEAKKGQAGKASFTHGSRSYSIALPAPEFPG
jgi:hypothetical protein